MSELARRLRHAADILDEVSASFEVGARPSLFSSYGLRQRADELDRTGPVRPVDPAARAPLPPVASFTNQTYTTYESDKVIVGQVDSNGTRYVVVLQYCREPERAMATPLSPGQARQMAASLLNHADEVEIHLQKAEEH